MSQMKQANLNKPLLGVALDAQRSTADETGKRLYFTGGEFVTPWSLKYISDFVITLKAEDYQCDIPCLYDVYFNPANEAYQIIEKGTKDDLSCSPGYLIGGFQIDGCKFMFLEAKCNNIKFVRPFTESFNAAYRKLDCDCKGDYNTNAFSDEFKTECALVQDPNANKGAFVKVSFTPGFDVT